MPLDIMMSDAILGTFRNMLKDCSDQNITGADFDAMKKAMDRMEELAQQHDDLNVFSGQVSQENLYAQFSDAYGRALSAKASADIGKPEELSDSDLLKMSLNALRDAVKRIRESKEEAIERAKSYDPKKASREGYEFMAREGMKKGDTKVADNIDVLISETNKSIDETKKKKPNAFDDSVEVDVLFKDKMLTEPIEKLIKLGEEPGMSMPRFLRLQIERGMDKAMEGKAVEREGMVYMVGWYKSAPVNPHYIKREDEKLALFDKLAAENKFKVPNSDELAFGIQRIDYKYEPDIRYWEEIVSRWEDLLWDLSFWSLAYIPKAPLIPPWSLAKDPHKAVRQTKETSPGYFVQRERLMKKYFDLNFPEAMSHYTMEYKVKEHLINYSQEHVEFLLDKVYPQCKPFNHLTEDNIKIRERHYDDPRENNPLGHMPAVRLMKYYDSVFGEGRFASKFDVPEIPNTKAAPWNWDSFTGR